MVERLVTRLVDGAMRGGREGRVEPNMSLARREARSLVRSGWSRWGRRREGYLDPTLGVCNDQTCQISPILHPFKLPRDKGIFGAIT